MLNKIFYTIVMILLLSTNAGAVYFSDIVNNPYKNSIYTLQEEGIISGYADGTFHPNDFVSRAQFAKMILKYYDYNIDNSCNVSLKDVSRNAWYYTS